METITAVAELLGKPRETKTVAETLAEVMSPVLVAKHTEFETKYRVDPAMLTEFKSICDKLPNLEKFIYVEGPDTYYTNQHTIKQFEILADVMVSSGATRAAESMLKLINETIATYPPFMRFRTPSHGLDGDRKELTTKYKQTGVKNNVQREEKNLRVDKTDEDTVKAFVENLGYKLNFSIWKSCHIYNYSDATLVFYSVYDTTNGKATKVDNFVEIEVSEEKITEMTEKEAWEIVEKYEKTLESVGLTARSRLRKSLFEMYKREIK